MGYYLSLSFCTTWNSDKVPLMENTDFLHSNHVNIFGHEPSWLTIWGRVILRVIMSHHWHVQVVWRHDNFWWPCRMLWAEKDDVDKKCLVQWHLVLYICILKNTKDGNFAIIGQPSLTKTWVTSNCQSSKIPRAVQLPRYSDLIRRFKDQEQEFSFRLTTILAHNIHLHSVEGKLTHLKGLACCASTLTCSVCLARILVLLVVASRSLRLISQPLFVLSCLLCSRASKSKSPSTCCRTRTSWIIQEPWFPTCFLCPIHIGASSALPHWRFHCAILVSPALHLR